MTIIVVESGARGNLQKRFTSELHEAMTSVPTAKEEEREFLGFLGYIEDDTRYEIPDAGFEASFPVLLLAVRTQ